MFRTPAQKRANCANCPVARVADLVGDSWSILIVRDLLTGEQRFGDLESSLSGISSRTLAKKLKMLESCGLIGRTDAGYALSKKGQELCGVIDAMRAFGEKHLAA